MRTIKFRAWDKKENRWLFGYKEMGGFNLMGEIIMLGEFSSIPLEKLKDVEIMQFTGLLDKNGKEIYEGDLIRYYLNFTDASINEIRQCIWYHSGFGFKKPDEEDQSALYMQTNRLEVIGNIYSNPELLTSKKT